MQKGKKWEKKQNRKEKKRKKKKKNVAKHTCIKKKRLALWMKEMFQEEVKKQEQNILNIINC